MKFKVGDWVRAKCQLYDHGTKIPSGWVTIVSKVGTSHEVIDSDAIWLEGFSCAFHPDNWELCEPPPEIEQKALKHDTGKAPLSMIPREALEELAAGFGYGAKKYSRGNFRQSSMAHSRLVDAALRHIVAMANGEDMDSESGNSHLSHALCSLAMLAFQRKHYPEANDLYLPVAK